MFDDHDTPMVLAHGLALLGWLAIARLWPSLWPAREAWRPERPGRELVLALLAVAGVLAVGQLWSADRLLPEGGALAPLPEAVNQLLIFAPVLLLPLLRRQPARSAWWPAGRLPSRLAAGLCLALLAATAYALLRRGVDGPLPLIGRLVDVQHLDELVQVLCEDLAVAILFVRCAALLGQHRAVVLVALLFAAGHVPALLAEGAGVADLLPLVRDAVLGVAVLTVLRRSQDIVWFWWVHTALDLTQFARVSGVG